MASLATDLSYETRIAELVAICGQPALPPFPSVQLASSTSELEDIRAQMIHLNQRLEQQQVLHTQQLQMVHNAAEDKLAKWRRHCDGLVAEGMLLVASLPAVTEMSSE